MKKILVIQTAFIGDVVLSTALIESLHQYSPQAEIDILVRKGNESLFVNHPFLHEVLVWNKQERKYIHWLKILQRIRSNQYDIVLNVQRYAATGLWTILSGSKMTIGFDKNPFSFFFDHSILHHESVNGLHEIHKNHALLFPLGDLPLCKPALYPTLQDVENVKTFQQRPYICIAPASVWFTKQFPVHKWIEFVNEIPFQGDIFIIGGPADSALGDKIILGTLGASGQSKRILNLAGKLSFLSSAALQQKAVLNYVNDSAPMHFASALNAPVAAIYCSTIPSFGYGPLSDRSFIIEAPIALACRPCGVHGKKHCPLGHFQCAEKIEKQQLYTPLLEMTQH